MWLQWIRQVVWVVWLASTWTLTWTCLAFCKTDLPRAASFTVTPFFSYSYKSYSYKRNSCGYRRVTKMGYSSTDEQDGESSHKLPKRMSSRDVTSFHPGDYQTDPIIDQEGRQWRSPEDLGRLRRDGLKRPEESYVALPDDEYDNDNDNDGGKTKTELGISVAYLESVQPYVATMKKHSMMLRDMEMGDTKNEKKGRFVCDEERWLHKYDALVRFHERYGHTYVPTLMKDLPIPECYPDLDFHNNTYANYLDHDFMDAQSTMELGQWVNQQRHHYKFYNGTRMTLQRVQYLNALNFQWDINEARWHQQYQDLKHFHNTFGHTLVRQNTTLGYWIYKQRYYQRCIDKRHMLDLATVPPAALTSNPIDPKDKVSFLPNGGRTYKGKVISPLTPTRRKLLDDIGFIWDHWDNLWETNFARLVQFKNKYGHTRVSYAIDPSLHDWVRKHRAKWKKMQHDKHQQSNPPTKTSQTKHIQPPNDTDSVSPLLDTNTEINEPTLLKPERIQKLNDIDFEWVIQRYTWEDNYNHLLDYKATYGHVNVPQNYNDPDRHPNLGPWLSTQRVTYRKDRKRRLDEQQNPTVADNNGTKRRKTKSITTKMPKDRIQKLEAIGVVWEPALVKFEERVDEYIGYRRQGKNIPKALRTWVDTTMEEYKKHLKGGSSKLDHDRIQILNDAKFLER